MKKKDEIVVTRLLGDLGAVDFNPDNTVELTVFLQRDPVIHAKFRLTHKDAHVLGLVVEHLSKQKPQPGAPRKTRASRPEKSSKR